MFVAASPAIPSHPPIIAGSVGRQLSSRAYKHARGSTRPGEFNNGNPIQFAIFDSKQHGIDAALDNLTHYHGLSLRQTLSKWLTGDPNGASDPEGYTTADYLAFAEQTINRLGGTYDPDALRFADGGVITEPVVGRGQRSMQHGSPIAAYNTAPELNAR